METVDIICLANSRKLNGRCVAGKRTDWFEWARPLSPLSETGELTLRDVTYGDRTEVKVLDIVRIPFLRAAPKPHQPEDFKIGRGIWTKMDEFRKRDIEALCDRPKDVWLHGPDADRIEERWIGEYDMRSSLMLIKPEPGAALVNEYISGRYRLKCRFSYNGKTYCLSVTDLEYEKRYANGPAGEIPLPGCGVYLCVSLGEPYNGYCYKLIATILAV